MTNTEILEALNDVIDDGIMVYDAMLSKMFTDADMLRANLQVGEMVIYLQDLREKLMADQMAE